jgi:mannosidase alpha-like ER degradation enhancer 1
VGDWFSEVDMFNGKNRRNRVENLQAFWPGMEALLGLSEGAARQLNAFFAVWRDLRFLPEEFDQGVWMEGRAPANSWYPLRPELIESTYYQYRTTR